MDRVVGLIEKLWLWALAPLGAYLWDSVWFWRIGFIVFAITIYAGVLSRDAVKRWLLRDKYEQHDTEVLRQMLTIIGIDRLRSGLHGLNDYAMCRLDYVQGLRDLHDHLIEPQNWFLAPPLRKRAARMARSIRSTVQFVDEEFTTPAPGNLELGSVPSHNSPKPEESRAKREARMRRIVREALGATAAFVMAVDRSMPGTRQGLGELDAWAMIEVR